MFPPNDYSPAAGGLKEAYFLSWYAIKSNNCQHSSKCSPGSLDFENPCWQAWSCV